MFMKPGNILLMAAACIMIMCGCKDDKPKYGAPMNIRIFGVMGKADLESGLKLGLFVNEPVGADNVPMTVSEDGSVEPDKEIKWAFDQTQSSRFLAYAPFDESFTGQESVTISTPADQSTKEKMLVGNLLMGITSGSPKESAVTMKLKHAMTAMTVSFDNRTGQRIEALTVAGFMTVGTLNLITGSLTATDSKKVITPMRSPSDDNSFSFIYIPQNVTPVFNVTLSSGKTMAFTYDNYCHEYPGSIIKMNIQLDESTAKANILKLSGVNITQWTSNGVPSFASVPEYISLSGLKKVQPDEDEDGFFSAYLNKVTVTAVDRTSEDILGVILEDSTCAIHVWTNYDSPLKVGNTIVGPVLGLMDKPSENEFHISHFYTSYATIGKTKELPCTNGNFGALADKIGKWEYRRMRFENVKLEKCFSNDRAVFVQDTVRVSVICPGIDVTLAKGVKGDLIGFPVCSGSDIMIMVYEPDQFSKFYKDASDNVLTRDSIVGLYDLMTPDTAIYLMDGPDKDVQYSVRHFTYGRTMQVSDTRNEEVFLFLVYDCTDKPVSGHQYKVAFNAMGKSGMKGLTMMMECVKVDDNTAWLIEKTGKYGLILAL